MSIVLVGYTNLVTVTQAVLVFCAIKANEHERSFDINVVALLRRT